jgi:WD repeat-containing protein 61
LAAGGQDGSVAIFDVATSKLKHTLEGHSMTIRSVAFTNDSERLLTASDDKHINVYDV